MKKDKKKKRTKHEHFENEPVINVLPPQSELTEKESGQESLRRAAAIAGGKWKLRVLWSLRSGSGVRYGTIKQQVSGITDMMLSQSLRELTADGLAERRQFQEIPPKVEYRITPIGVELLPAIDLFRAWALKYEKETQKNG